MSRTGSDDQYITPSHLRPLPCQARLQPFQFDPSRLEWLIVRHTLNPFSGTLCGPPSFKVDQHTPPHDPLLLQVLNAQEVLVLLGGVVDVGHGGVVVEALGFLVCKVPEAVPLRGGLRVECPDVVVDHPGALLKHVFVEGLTGEEDNGPLEVEGGVEGYPGFG